MSNILPKKSWNVYNDQNKEKVRHDEEKARIEEEVCTAKLEQDERSSRLARLRALRSLPNQQEPVSDKNLEKKPRPYEIARKRFTLFPEEEPPSTLLKKTKTQIEVEERKDLLKPVGFDQVKRDTPWYLKKESAKVPISTHGLAVKTSSQKTIDDLRRERLEREAKERERAKALERKKH